MQDTGVRRVRPGIGRQLTVLSARPVRWRAHPLEHRLCQSTAVQTSARSIQAQHSRDNDGSIGDWPSRRREVWLGQSAFRPCGGLLARSRGVSAQTERVQDWQSLDRHADSRVNLADHAEDTTCPLLTSPKISGCSGVRRVHPCIGRQLTVLSARPVRWRARPRFQTMPIPAQSLCAPNFPVTGNAMPAEHAPLWPVRAAKKKPCSCASQVKCTIWQVCC